MIERENNIYIWNEFHSIVVVKYKQLFNFRMIANQGNNEENYIILFVREVQTHIVE